MPVKIRIVEHAGGGKTGHLSLHGGGTMELTTYAGDRGFTGALDPTVPRIEGRLTGRFSGSPYSQNTTGEVTMPDGSRIPVSFGPSRYGQIRVGLQAGLLQLTGTSFRVPTRGMPTGVGVFRLEALLPQLLVRMTPVVAQIMSEEAEKMEEEARNIAPVDTGSYKSGLSFTVGTTPGSVGPRGGRRSGPSLKITGTVDRGEGERDPRAYSMFVELGSWSIPAHAVLRRTLDWGAPRLINRLQTEVGPRAVRAGQVSFIPPDI